MQILFLSSAMHKKKQQYHHLTQQVTATFTPGYITSHKDFNIPCICGSIIARTSSFSKATMCLGHLIIWYLTTSWHTQTGSRPTSRWAVARRPHKETCSRLSSSKVQF